MRLIDADLMKAEVESLDAESNNRIYKCAMEDMLEFFVELIDKQPTIEQEARHGKWIFRDDDKSLIEEGILPANMWCSNCGKHHDNDDYGDDYCSTCGVKMDLPDEYEEKTWGADNDA